MSPGKKRKKYVSSPQITWLHRIGLATHHEVQCTPSKYFLLLVDSLFALGICLNLCGSVHSTPGTARKPMKQLLACDNNAFEKRALLRYLEPRPGFLDQQTYSLVVDQRCCYIPWMAVDELSIYVKESRCLGECGVQPGGVSVALRFLFLLYSGQEGKNKNIKSFTPKTKGLGRRLFQQAVAAMILLPVCSEEAALPHRISPFFYQRSFSKMYASPIHCQHTLHCILPTGSLPDVWFVNNCHGPLVRFQD